MTDLLNTELPTICLFYQTQNTVFSAVKPLATSFTSSITSSLASSIGSESSSPTTLSTMNAKATPFYPGSNTVESVIGTCVQSTWADEPTSAALCFAVRCKSGVFSLLSGSALDLNFSDINVASLDKELEEQDNNVGLPSKYFQAQMVSSSFCVIMKATAVFTLSTQVKGCLLDQLPLTFPAL